MGYERSLVQSIGRIIDAFVSGFPKSLAVSAPASRWAATREECDKAGLKGTSPNHRDLGVFLELARAAAWGSSAEYEAAARQAHAISDQHLEALWTSEQTTGRPHGGFYLVAECAGRIGARANGDTALLAKLDERARREVSYMVLTATPQLEVWCCGERMAGGPLAQQQTAWLRELHGHQHEGELDPKRFAKNIGSDDWVSLRGMRALLAAGDDFGGALDITAATAEFPPVARLVEVQRWEGGHLARYTQHLEGPAAAGVCDWVLVDHGVADAAKERTGDAHLGITYGTEFSRPVPLQRVPAVARKITSGRRAA